MMIDKNRNPLNINEQIADQINRLHGADQHKKNKILFDTRNEKIKKQYFQNHQNKGAPIPDDDDEKKYRTQDLTPLHNENYRMKIKNKDRLDHDLNRMVNNKPKDLNDIPALVLSGGGAKGIAYAHMLDVLDPDQFQIIAGSSAGALTAFCLAIGLSIEESKKIIKIPLKDTISKDTQQTYGNKNSIEALFKMSSVKRDHSSTTDKIKSILKKAIRSKLSKLLDICIILKNDKIHQSVVDINIGHQNTLIDKYNKIATDQIQKHRDASIISNLEINKKIAEANITLDTYSLKKYWEEDKESNKLVFKLELQNTLNLLNDLLNKKKDFDYSFKDHEKVRAACSKIHIDPKMKDLLVTATKLNTASDPNSSASDSLTVFRTGDKRFDNVSMIQASAASGCFPGVLEPEEINGQMYVDGGIVDNKPICELQKHVEGEHQKNEEIKIISQLQDLNGVDQNTKDAIIKKCKEKKNYSPNILSVDIGNKPGSSYDKNHKLNGVGASFAINIINKILSYCKASKNLKIPTEGYGGSQAEKNLIVKALTKNNQITHANIKPSGVETLTGEVTGKQLENMRKAIIDEMKKMFRKFNDRINKR